MASETITRNDLTNILNEVLPPTPSEYKKLLWTNTSTSYSTGTIPLDLSEYDEVEILFYADDSFAMSFYSRAKVGKNGLASWWDVRTDSSNLNNINSVTRQYSVSTSGVTFQNGNMIYNGGSYAGWAGRCVPYQIYGIKYERVAPPQVEFPNYSTEEQQVGTWIDGKTIYRKVYVGLSFGGTANAWTDTGATITGADKIISCRALNLSGVIQTLMGFRINNNKIQYWCAQTWNGTTCIIIEYTKS